VQLDRGAHQLSSTTHARWEGLSTAIYVVSRSGHQPGIMDCERLGGEPVERQERHHLRRVEPALDIRLPLRSSAARAVSF
jgi:hypothetical protein